MVSKLQISIIANLHKETALLEKEKSLIVMHICVPIFITNIKNCSVKHNRILMEQLNVRLIIHYLALQLVTVKQSAETHD